MRSVRRVCARTARSRVRVSPYAAAMAMEDSALDGGRRAALPVVAAQRQDVARVEYDKRLLGRGRRHQHRNGRRKEISGVNDFTAQRAIGRILIDRIAVV